MRRGVLRQAGQDSPATWLDDPIHPVDPVKIFESKTRFSDPLRSIPPSSRPADFASWVRPRVGILATDLYPIWDKSYCSVRSQGGPGRCPANLTLVEFESLPFVAE